MEGTGSKLSSRRVATKTAAALLTIGVLSVALSACGSGSSSDANGSTASVVNKEAGSSDVQLDVVNQTPDDLEVTMCGNIKGNLNDSGNCPEGGYLSPGDSFHLTLAEVGGRIGFRTLHDSAGIDYNAVNPDVGEPGFDLWKPGIDKRDPPSQEFRLSEGESKTTDIGVHSYKMSRANDTDVKVMTMTVLR